MSIGPRDMTDKKLVQIYKNSITSNLDRISMIDTNQMLNNMLLMGINNQTYLTIRKNLARTKSSARKKIA